MRSALLAKSFRILCLGVLSGNAAIANAGAEWNSADYSVYPGDFNADGKTDFLYVATADTGRSGIALGGVPGQPNTLLQDWGSAAYGVEWHSNIYKPIVADFTGDGRSDILMQRQTPGYHYLLVTGSDGKLSGTLQQISNVQNGLDWSGSAHRIIAGKFNGDTKADLFFQSTSASGINAVLLADANGQFTSGSPYQSWGDLYLNVRWSLPKAVIHAGDFDGNGTDDLLVQAKPDVVMIDYEVPFPIPVYRPNSFGILMARDSAGGYVFRGTATGDIDQFWSRNYLGLDWSALKSEIVLGRFDSAAGVDILLQSRTAGRDNVFVLTNGTTHRAETLQTISNSTVRTASLDQFRLFSGAWDNTGPADLYVQASSPGATNYIVQDPLSNGPATAHNPFMSNVPASGTAVGAIGGIL